MRTATDERTLPELILSVAGKLDDEFSAEELVVAAWKAHPQRFGLPGYADQYPDANKVLSALMGEKGMVRKGWFRRSGKKRYGLTDYARMILRSRNHKANLHTNGTAAKRVTLTQADEDYLLLLYEIGQPLAWDEALEWWCVTDNTPVQVMVSGTETILAKLNEQLQHGDSVLRNGRVVSLADIQEFQRMHQRLQVQFAKQLRKVM